MGIWKRNAVVAAIVLFVCTAVYLNWSYTASDTATGESSAVAAGKTLGEAELVSSGTQMQLSNDTAAEQTIGGIEDSLAQDALGEEELAEEIAETAVTGGYFDTARLNREEARDSALTILQETVNSPDADTAAVTAASDSITAMATATLQESEIENLVTAKGYTDCVAFIGENSVSVVVASPKGDLQADDVARVTDIVCGETSFAAANVKVIQAE